MAMKVVLAAALLAALVALSTATTYTTTVITTSEDENYQQCRQMVRGMPFRYCQRYLRQSTPFNGEEEEVEEEEEEAGESENQQTYLQQCCQQLRQMDRQHCGCEAIRHAARQAQQKGGSLHTTVSSRIIQRARALPRRCGMHQQQCRFTLVFV